MDLTTANLAVKVAIEKAEEMGGKFSVAVLDGGVNLVAFSRMDGGRVGTIDVAMKKVLSLLTDLTAEWSTNSRSEIHMKDHDVADISSLMP